MRGLKTLTRSNVSYQFCAGVKYDFNATSQRLSAGRGADKRDLHALTSALAVVLEQRGRSSQMTDHQIDVSVVIEITRRRRSSEPTLYEIGPGQF